MINKFKTWKDIPMQPIPFYGYEEGARVPKDKIVVKHIDAQALFREMFEEYTAKNKIQFKSNERTLKVWLEHQDSLEAGIIADFIKQRLLIE